MFIVYLFWLLVFLFIYYFYISITLLTNVMSGVFCVTISRFIHNYLGNVQNKYI